jgi:hypothetical protein
VPYPPIDDRSAGVDGLVKRERVLVGIVVTVLVLIGVPLATGAWFASALGCPLGGAGSDAARSASLRLERVVGELPAVVASESDYTESACADSASIRITVPRGAHPDQVAEVVRVAHAGLQGPEFEDVNSTELSVEPDERLGPTPADGKFAASGDAAAQEVVAEARAWAVLHRRHPGASVGSAGRGWVDIPLTAPVEPGAVTEAFDLMRELGLDGAGHYLPSWHVWVALSPAQSRYSEGDYYRAQGRLPPQEAVAAMGSVAAWSALLGPDIVVESRATWWTPPDSQRPRLQVQVDIDLDLAERTADDVADELAAIFDATAAPYELEIRSASSDLQAVRSSG